MKIIFSIISVTFISGCFGNSTYKCNFYPKINRPQWITEKTTNIGNYITAKAPQGKHITATKQMELAKKKARKELAIRLGSIKIISQVRNQIIQRQQDITVSADSIIETVMEHSLYESTVIDEYLDRNSCLYWVLVGIDKNIIKEKAIALMEQRDLLTEVKTKYELLVIESDYSNIENLAKEILVLSNKVDRRALSHFGYKVEVKNLQKIQQHVRQLRDQSITEKYAQLEKEKFDSINKQLAFIQIKVSILNEFRTSRIFKEAGKIKSQLNSILVDSKKLNYGTLVKAGYLENKNKIVSEIDHFNTLVDKAIAEKVLWASRLSSFTYRQRKEWLYKAYLFIKTPSHKKRVRQQQTSFNNKNPILVSVRPGATLSEIESRMAREGFSLKKIVTKYGINYPCSVKKIGGINRIVDKGECSNKSVAILQYDNYWLQIRHGLFECSMHIDTVTLSRYLPFLSSYRMHWNDDACKTD